MSDIVRELRSGNLFVSGEARHINSLLGLHRMAAEEIERLRAIISGSAEHARVGFSSNSPVVMRQSLNVIHTALASVRMGKPAVCTLCDDTKAIEDSNATLAPCPACCSPSFQEEKAK